jgi:hypothetical protein
MAITPRTAVDDEADVADLNVMKISKPRHQCDNTSAMTEYYKFSTS